MTNAKGFESGFTLVELLVAMVISLIVTGAIFGLMSGGQNAFRREPLIIEQQQNIRIGMDMIMRDIANAGAGLPALMQVFTTGLNSIGASVMIDGVPTLTDELEMLTDDTGQANQPACGNPGTSNNLRLYAGTSPTQVSEEVTIVLFDHTTQSLTWTRRRIDQVSNPNSGEGNCPAGYNHVQLGQNPGGTNPAPASWGLCQNGIDAAGNKTVGGYPPPGEAAGDCDVLYVASFSSIRWRIFVEADGTPVLQRRRNQDPWTTVARNIENMQVQYFLISDGPFDPSVVPSDNAPAVDIITPDYSTLTSRVRVTLTAKSEGLRARAETAAQIAAGQETGEVRRSSLTSESTVRSTLFGAALAPVAPGSAPQWQ